MQGNDPVSKQPSHHMINRRQPAPRVQMLERAAFALRTRRFTEAEQLAAEILRGSRTDTAAVSILAHALIAQNREAEAIPHLEKAIRRGDDPGLETLLGAALGGAGRRADAIDQLRRTVARRPPFAPAFQELAGQLSKAGRNEEAIDVIEKAIAVLPGLVDLDLALARLHLVGNARGTARVILEKAREAAPGRTDIMIELARLTAVEGEYGAAVDIYRHALGLNPDDALTRAELAICLLEMCERESGEAALRKVVHGRPQLLGRAAHALAVSSHGRFFFRPSALAKFLQE
jgi:tetratricopeptide (TPR) repeat protein